jgi:tRNA1Val (adenine37-N6)-methyltransferase
VKTTLDTILDLRFHQHLDGYRFSMDAVLLADFVRARTVRNMADLGAGSGVVGILLARRYPKAEVTLVELQKGLHSLCERNIKENSLEDRVRALRADIRELAGELTGLDLVVSNPPFRRPGSGLLSEGEEKIIARHEVALTLPELARAASGMLKARGRFCLVYLPERLADAVQTLRESRLEPKRVRFVHGRMGSEARIMLLEAVRQGRPGMKVEPPLIVYEDDGKTYTREVRRMYE